MLRRSLLETHAAASKNGLPVCCVEADAEVPATGADWVAAEYNKNHPAEKKKS